MESAAIITGQIRFKDASRGEKLRDAMLANKPKMCAERAKTYSEVYQKNKQDPMVVLRGKALKNHLESMTIYILDDELIVGNQASTPRSAPIFPETESRYILDEGIGVFETRIYDPFGVSPEVAATLEEVLPQWDGKTVEEIATGKIPKKTLWLMEEIPYKVFHSEIHFRGGIGHVSGGFDRVLAKGFEGIKKETEERMAQLDLSDPINLGKLQFYQTALIVCEGVITFAKRFADLAREKAGAEENPERKKELENIACVCDRIPAKPAGTFHEAVQCIWFSHLLLQIESNGLGASPGRIDQYLYPFYVQDLASGAITQEQAQELVDCFWVKIEEIKRVYDSECAQDFSGYTTGLNITIGGQNPDGTDATNDISYMCLNALEKLKTAHPNFTVRYHGNLPEKLLSRACEVVRLGTGMPEFMNDEAHIPSLVNRGIELADARGYTNIGCVEPAVPGKTCSWSNAAMFNLGKCLELALNDGKCMLSNEQIGPHTGVACEFKSIEEVIAAYKIQVAYFVKHMVISLNSIDNTHAEILQTPYLSLLVDDCLKNGTDITAGGAHYNFTSPQGVGVADVADSLSVIKKMVFEEQKISFEQLLSAVKTNFEGEEELRLSLLLGAPKYGNDDDYVDLLAKKSGRIYCEEVEKYKNPRGGTYNPGLYPVSAHVPLGRNTAALPSGRKAFKPLADGVSPTHGSDKNGPTAVVNSVAKLDHVIASNGTLLNQKFHPTVLQDGKGLKSLADLISTFFKMGGKHIQFNVVDSNTLKDARKNPEKYAGLAIRVAGYSAFFTQLSKDMQDDIIGRTEQQGF